MGCAHKENQDGFTLVEISIVMIIIGLLIGGTFGGMKLIENMQVNKTVQDLKSFDAAGLTFKDSYGRLPGDLRNPSTRLPNCTSVPCSTSGNGDRKIYGDYVSTSLSNTLLDTDEAFTYWHHLSAAGLIAAVNPTTNLSFGEGQPSSPIGGGYRMAGFIGTVPETGISYNKHVFWVSDRFSSSYLSGDPTQNALSLSCAQIRSVDGKIDDDKPNSGRVAAAISGCNDGTGANANWANLGAGTGPLVYYLSY